MKRNMAMIIFFSIVLLIMVGVNVYLYKHTRPIFSIGNWYGLSMKILFVFFAASYPLGRTLERIIPSITSEYIATIGAFWLGAMLYLTLMFLFFDILKLISTTFGWPLVEILKENILLHRKITFSIYLATGAIILGGYINALYPKVSKLAIETSKEIGETNTIRIAAASDIHLGTIISNGRLERFVELMNGQNPDVIVLAGDIFDEDLGPVIKNDMGKLISQLKAPLGVYAVTGNHEYIGGAKAAIEYLENHNVIVLRDTTNSVGNFINIVGRDDRQARVMGGTNRKSLKDIVKSINNERFTILLDHQPYNLNEAIENGIDLQISGHTHHGQMFPLNFITRAIFEVSRGYKQIENTHFYVLTGYGTWGPPVRVGNRPEILVVEIKNKS